MTMNTPNIRQDTPAVVRPSRFVRVVIRPMTKVLNPVMRGAFRMLGIRQFLLLKVAGD